MWADGGWGRHGKGMQAELGKGLQRKAHNAGSPDLNLGQGTRYHMVRKLRLQEVV